MQRFDITLDKGGRKTVEGYVKYSRLLDIHQHPDDPDDPFEAWWTITHIPTGLAFCSAATKTGANRIAKVIHDHMVDEKVARSSDPEAILRGFGQPSHFADVVRQLVAKEKSKPKKK